VYRGSIWGICVFLSDVVGLLVPRALVEETVGTVVFVTQLYSHNICVCGAHEHCYDAQPLERLRCNCS
jgi:hypothetical protein